MTQWIEGGTRSGKTTTLLHALTTWVTTGADAQKPIQPTVLCLAANDDNRRALQDQIAPHLWQQMPILCKTPLGFVTDEVQLFWPLLTQKLHLAPQLPIRLRPETEQELATQLWQSQLDEQPLRTEGIVPYRFVRDTLDVMQLAGAANIPIAQLSRTLVSGLDANSGWEYHPETSQFRQQLLNQWRSWCLDRALLSYGLISELYGQYLLSDRTYKAQLKHRYCVVFADDVQDYPALIKPLLQVLMQVNSGGVLTFNPDSYVRLGLNADPQLLAELAHLCTTQIHLSGTAGLAQDYAPTIVAMTLDSTQWAPLPPVIQCIETITRSQLLRQTADRIVAAVQTADLHPHEIAVIAPGLDAIARYSFVQILRDRGIPVTPLNEQKPLNASPLVRSLLTLLPFIYDGLGDCLNRERVAEMLVMLSRGLTQPEVAIDPVRAGLLAEYCYHADVVQPRFDPVTIYARWDRLGHQAVQQYAAITSWIAQQRQTAPEISLTPPILLDRAIHRFLWHGGELPYAELAALRGLMESAYHFWQIHHRLQAWPDALAQAHPIRTFIELLQAGTITANASPTPLPPARSGVMLATIYQYRALRQSHRWHFWLDAGSRLWANALIQERFGAAFFLRSWDGFPLDLNTADEVESTYIQQVLRDLLGRVEERLYLCNSELTVQGLDQTGGPLINLVQAADRVPSHDCELVAASPHQREPF